MAFPDAIVGEKRGDGIDGSPELGEGELAASGGVHEGDLAMVGPGRDECGDVQGVVGWVSSGLAFAVEDGVGLAETAPRVNRRVAIIRCHWDTMPFSDTCLSSLPFTDVCGCLFPFCKLLNCKLHCFTYRSENDRLLFCLLFRSEVLAQAGQEPATKFILADHLKFGDDVGKVSTLRE